MAVFKTELRVRFLNRDGATLDEFRCDVGCEAALQMQVAGRLLNETWALTPGDSIAVDEVETEVE